MAMAARRERGLFDPDAAAGASPFDHHICAIASDGDIEEGISHEVALLAGHQQLGNLTVICDDNHISIEDDTDDRAEPRTSPRATRRTAGTSSASTGRGRGDYVEDVDGAAPRRWRPPGPRPAGRRSSRCARSSAGPRRHKQNTGKIHGSALGAEEVAATKKVLGFDPEQSFDGRPPRC